MKIQYPRYCNFSFYFKSVIIVLDALNCGFQIWTELIFISELKREKFFSNKSRKKWLSKREKWIQSILYGTGVTVLIQPPKCFWLLSVSWRVVDLYWNFLLIWLELCVFYGTRKNINLRYGIFSWVSLYKFKCAFLYRRFQCRFWRVCTLW